MSAIKRFIKRDQERVQNTSQENGEGQEAGLTGVMPASTGRGDAPNGEGALKQIHREEAQPKAAHRAAPDFLNILKSLAPVFKAASIYPGIDAAPEQIARAVRHLSQTSVDLVEFIAANGDMLEIDSAWARKTLHEFAAELVSSYWISSVIAKGDGTGLPAITADLFKPAVRVAMALPANLPKQDDKLNLTTNGAVQVSLLKALTPVTIEVEKFAAFVATHAPGSAVSAAALIKELSEFLVALALAHHNRFLEDNPESSEDDRRIMLQALIGHTASVTLSAWEYCKGEVYAAIGDSKTAQSVTDYFARDEFTHGFPLQALKKRAEESLRRLVGSAACALSILRRQAAGQ